MDTQVGKQCVAIDFLEVRNKSLFQSGLLVLFSLTGIIFAWWLLREAGWITWLITGGLILIAVVAIFYFIQTNSLFSRLGVV